VLLIRPQLTLASIIWAQRRERKFCQKERKLNKYVSPAVLLCAVSQHPVTFLLCHSEFPNKVISHTGLGLSSGALAPLSFSSAAGVPGSGSPGEGLTPSHRHGLFRSAAIPSLSQSPLAVL